MHIVVATLNGLPYTKRLLIALEQVRLPLHTVVIDNGSTDGTPDWIARLRRHDGRHAVAGGLTLVPHGRNTGVAAAWNLGLRIALHNGTDKILVCGNDTRPMPGTIERLAAQVDQGIQFITGTTVPYDTPEAPIAPAEASERLLAAPEFSFFMLAPSAIEAVARSDRALEQSMAVAQQGKRPAILPNPWDWGMFDERYYPACFEDNDYYVRLLRAGVCAVRDPGALFLHETSLTVRVNPEVRDETRRAFARNADLFRAKWGCLPWEMEPIAPLDLRPIVARPANMTDEQWLQFGGGYPVVEVDRERAIAAGRSADPERGARSPAPELLSH